MSTLDDFTTTSDPVDDDEDQCDCEHLPSGVPCFGCFLDGEATFERGGA